jgi:hypothetical protein
MIDVKRKPLVSQAHILDNLRTIENAASICFSDTTMVNSVYVETTSTMLIQFSARRR